MARFVKGDVVVLPFPFSDLTQTKKRPALVVASLSGDDVILVQITSQAARDAYSILLDNSDFTSGTLNRLSNIRPNRIFTADGTIVLYRIGSVKQAKMDLVIARITEIIRA